MSILFFSEKYCPSNRDRLDTWYRKALPALTSKPNTWSYLRVRGEAIKRQWRAHWKQRDTLKSNSIIYLKTRKTP